MYLIYEGHLWASFIIYLRFTLTIYILLLFYFVFLLFILYIFHLFFSFFVFCFYMFLSLYFIYMFSLFFGFFPLRIFCFALPENFIFVFYFWFAFMDISSYSLPHTKKRSSIPEPLFSLFYFFEEFRCCSKLVCFSEFLFSLFESFF